MLKFLSRVKIEFNALDPRTAACMEFLAQCNARKAKESNPACQLTVKRRTDDHPPQITVTFVNGVEQVYDATVTPAQTIRTMILEKGQMLETEQMFREAGEKWPVFIPEEEIKQFAAGTKIELGVLKQRPCLGEQDAHNAGIMKLKRYRYLLGMNSKNFVQKVSIPLLPFCPLCWHIAFPNKHKV